MDLSAVNNHELVCLSPYEHVGADLWRTGIWRPLIRAHRPVSRRGSHKLNVENNNSESATLSSSATEQNCDVLKSDIRPTRRARFLKDSLV